MLIVSLVALFHVTELTVIPEPEKATVAPLAKPVPVTTIDWLVCPRALEFGARDVSVGLASTVKARPALLARRRGCGP